MWLARKRRFRGLGIVPFFVAMLAVSASAQTSPTLGNQSAVARTKSEAKRATIHSNQQLPKAGPTNITSSPKANTAAPITGAKSSDKHPAGIAKGGSSVVINIDKTKQRMTVFVDGVQKYDWPVSTGRAGYSTPSGTYTATSMNEIWYSKQWDNSPMPHSIFYMKDGHAIHGSYEVKNLGKPASHGCVRIAPENATTLYSLVAQVGLEKTQVILTGVTPGGESKVASTKTPRSRYDEAASFSNPPDYIEPGFGFYGRGP